MYLISEFSKITGLSTSTLRYYDQEKILVAQRRSKSNYRYYLETNIEKAKLLSMLRDYDFSIAEIKDILMTISDIDDLAYYLNEKKSFLFVEIKKMQSQIKKLDNLISNCEILGVSQDYKIVPVKIVDQLYIYKNYTGIYNEMHSEVNTLYSLAQERVNGDLFLLDTFDNSDISCKICLPVSEIIKTAEIKTGNFNIQKGLQVTHNGSYKAIGKAYKYLIDSVQDDDLYRNGNFLTRFLKGSGKIFKGNENNYKTEIVLLSDSEEKINETRMEEV